MVRWDRLRADGLFFCWEDGVFPPGTDSFLLSGFPLLRPGLRVCDLGCGTGLLGLLLLQRQPELRVLGLDLSPRALELAELARARNGLGPERLQFRPADLRDPADLRNACGSGAAPGSGPFDLVICNPPYLPAGSGAPPALLSARTESGCTLEELCAAAARLLRRGGRLCLVHRPERLTDALCALRAAGLEPKRLRFAEHTAGAAPSLLLLEGRSGGRPGLRVLAPLVLYRPDGTPSAELDAIYFRTKENDA